MKRIFSHILPAFAVVAIAFAGCKKTPAGQTPETTNTLSVDVEQLVFDPGDTAPKEVKVTTDATSWNATTTAQWLEITPDQEAKTLRVAVRELNLTAATLSGEIVFTAGNATEIRLSVRQFATPPTEEFDTFGLLIYYGNSFRNGTANFMLNCFDAVKSIGFNIEAFGELPDDGYPGFRLTEGRYVISESCELMTMLPGVTELSVFGSYIYSGVAPNLDEIIITSGTMDVSLDGDTYTIVTNFSGYDLKAKDTPLENLIYRFVGAIDYNDVDRTRDFSADIHGGRLSGAYSAVGVADYGNDATAPGDWTGTITADPDVEGRYTFAGGYLEHWCRLDQNELLLDGTNSIVRSKVGDVDVDVYVRAFAVKDGRLYWAYKEGSGYDYPLRYDRGGGRLMFRNRLPLDGAQYDVLIGAVGIDAAGEVYVMSQCYRDLEYTVAGLVEAAPTVLQAPAAIRVPAALRAAAAKTPQAAAAFKTSAPAPTRPAVLRLSAGIPFHQLAK